MQIFFLLHLSYCVDPCCIFGSLHCILKIPLQFNLATDPVLHPPASPLNHLPCVQLSRHATIGHQHSSPLPRSRPLPAGDSEMTGRTGTFRYMAPEVLPPPLAGCMPSATHVRLIPGLECVRGNTDPAPAANRRSDQRRTTTFSPSLQGPTGIRVRDDQQGRGLAVLEVVIMIRLE
jgi:hypothetical protein